MNLLDLVINTVPDSYESKEHEHESNEKDNLLSHRSFLVSHVENSSYEYSNVVDVYHYEVPFLHLNKDTRFVANLVNAYYRLDSYDYIAYEDEEETIEFFKYVLSTLDIDNYFNTKTTCADVVKYKFGALGVQVFEMLIALNYSITSEAFWVAFEQTMEYNASKAERDFIVLPPNLI